MRCTNCGAEIGADQKFCVSCGTQAAKPLYCTNCGAEIPSTAAFCTNCGQAGVRSAPAPPQPQPVRGPGPILHQGGYQPAALERPMQYRGVGPRLAATIVDTVLYFAFAWLVAVQTGNTSSSGFDLQGGLAIFTFALWGLYFLLMEAFAGGTVGKLVLGMRLVNDRGRSPGLVAALLRNLLRIADFLPAFYILGAILVASSGRKQRLGDRVAGTFVVSR